MTSTQRLTLSADKAIREGVFEVQLNHMGRARLRLAVAAAVLAPARFIIHYILGFNVEVVVKIGS